MNSTKAKLIQCSLVLLSACALMADAHAQFGGMGGRGAKGDRGARGESTGAHQPAQEKSQPSGEAISAEQIQYRINALQQDLKLAPEQAGPWQRFAEKVNAYGGDLESERARNGAVSASSFEPQNGVQRIGRAVDVARDHLAALEDIEAAARALYQALTPAQQSLADLRLATVVAPLTSPLAIGGSKGYQTSGSSLTR